MTRTFIWLGLFVGSSIGGAIPMLWGDDMLSPASLGLSLVGAVAGIFAGFRLARGLG